MHFFDTLSVAFHLWQYLCLSPFSLINHQMDFSSKNSHRLFSSTIISIQSVSIIICLVFEGNVIESNNSQVVSLLTQSTMALVQFSALMIFIESYKKRFVQMDFLRKINTIDFILEYKIGIEIDYNDQKKSNLRRLFRWLVLSPMIIILNLVLFHYFYNIFLWGLIVYASLFIYSMRYFQITSYIIMIYHRYHQINELISNIKLHDDNHQSVNVDLAKTLENVHTIFQKYKTGSIYDRINHLRRVCRLLSSANQCINEMFQWSIPLIVANDFLQIIINSFWIIRVIVLFKPKKFLILPLLWTLLNLNHVFSISSACHHATYEVFLFAQHF